ncbi:hypothetical protein JCM3765_003670 [Sporobolomyces pararoseus]
MAAPFDLTYEAPLGPVPDWLSYQVTPTATLILPFTVETLAQNGNPTAITGQATVTRYQTQLLQLPVTVSLPEGAEGEDQISLGPDYTTAGGDGPTIARVYGGTQLVTLAPTRPASSPTTGAISRQPSAPTISSTAASARTSAATATLASLSSAQVSIASALASASLVSQSSLVSSLSNDLSSISSAASSISPSLTATTTAPNSISSPASDSVSPPSSSSSAASSLSPNRLNSLTPSQLAAAIAAPICFFFLLVFLALLCCFCLRRRRRKRAAQDDNIFEGGLAGGGGLGGSWGAITGGVAGRRTREASEDWDWVEPRMTAGSRMGGYFGSSSSRAGTPLSRGTGGEGAGTEGGVSLLAGGGRYAHESPRNDTQEEEGDEAEDEDEGEIGTVMMREGKERRGKTQAAALGLGIARASSTSPGGRTPSLPERAAATLNAGLRRISGGRLGGGAGSSPESGYEYEPVRATNTPNDDDDDLEHEQEMIQHARIVTRPPYWDPYKPSPTTPQFPILAPVISATSSDEPSPRTRDQEDQTGEYSVNTSPDCEDVRRANLGLADLTNGSRWSGSPRTDETNTFDDHDDDGEEQEGDDEADQESTEMLASSREDASGGGGAGSYGRRPRMVEEEGNWFSGRPRPPPVALPPLLRVPSDLSISQYSQSDIGFIQGRRSDQGSSWLATPSRFYERNRSRENSGGSAASEVSMGSFGSVGGGNDKLSLKDLFFSAPRWTGARNPNTFPTSTISPIIPSGLVGHIDNMTPPPSSSSASSSSSSRYADAPISQPPSSTTRASFHTPRIGSDSHSPSFPAREGSGELTSATMEDSPMVYSVVPTPNTRTTRRAGEGARERRGRTRTDSSRPDSEDVLERAAKSYERERKNGKEGRRKMLEDEWKEIRLVEPETRSRDPYDAPFSNLTPLSSPLLPAPPTPPPAVSTPRKSTSSTQDRQQFLLSPPHSR